MYKWVINLIWTTNKLIITTIDPNYVLDSQNILVTDCIVLVQCYFPALFQDEIF